MPTPVIAGICRVAFLWDLVGQPLHAINVMHFENFDADESNLLDLIEANVTAGMWNWVTSNGSVVKLTALQLDGISAPRERTLAPLPKWTGGGNGEPVLQVAGIIKHNTTLGGRSHRGRTYLPWVAENKMDSGLINSVATVQAAWEAFLAAMIANAHELQVTSYKLLTSTPVAVVTAEARVATQRRRNKR